MARGDGKGLRLLVVAFPKASSVPYGDYIAMGAFVKPLLEPWLRQAVVAIVDPATKQVVRNYETGETTVTITPIYIGYSRIQPLRTALNSQQLANLTTTRAIQFQLEYPQTNTLPDIKSGYEVVVVNAPADPYLSKYQFVVTGSVNSSMAWNRTVETTTNLEARPNYDTTGWNIDGFPLPSSTLLPSLNLFPGEV